MKLFIKTSLALALLASTPQMASAFSISFNWDGLKSCTNGHPNRVKNPAFRLYKVPAGTKYIRFRLKDKDAPNYSHGGGLVAYKGQKTIAPGAFKYKSPCPPSGRHTYVWTAVAKKSKKGGKLAVAKSARKYP